MEELRQLKAELSCQLNNVKAELSKNLNRAKDAENEVCGWIVVPGMSLFVQRLVRVTPSGTNQAVLKISS